MVNQKFSAFACGVKDNLFEILENSFEFEFQVPLKWKRIESSADFSKGRPGDKGIVFIGENFQNDNVAKLFSLLSKKKDGWFVISANSFAANYQDSVKSFYKVENFFDIDLLFEQCYQILKEIGISEDGLKKKKQDIRFSRVKKDIIMDWIGSGLKIFIKLSEGNYEEIQLPEKREEAVKFLQKQYRDLGDFYIQTTDYLRLIPQVVEEIFESFDNISNFSLTQILHNSTRVLYLVHDLINKVGLDGTVVYMLGMLTKQVLSVSNQQFNFKTVMQFENNKSDYIVEHSLKLALLCSYILLHSPHGDKEDAINLVFACLFHDLAFEDNRLAKISDLEPDYVDGLELRESKTIMDHSTLMIRSLRQTVFESKMIIDLIHNHHNRKLDTETQKTDSLIFLHSVFYVCERFIIEMYRVNFDMSEIEIILFRLEEAYSDSAELRRAVDLLSEVALYS